ncbi:hypothetical protein NL676_003942 [Syzygium grande]|nr:hypothetical protein NL676_003942 [Syzygium grande]
MERPPPFFGIPLWIHQFTSTYPSGNGEAFVRYRSKVIIDIGEYYHQKQEYVAWCHRDAAGNVGEPLRTFDVPVDSIGLLQPIIAGGEVINPEATPEWMR